MGNVSHIFFTFVIVVAIGRGTKKLEVYRNANLSRTMSVKGRLGYATDSHDPDGKIWEKTTYGKCITSYTPIAFDERVTFCLQRSLSQPYLCVCVCCIVCMYDCVMVTREPHTQIMQHTHRQKAVTGCIEAKKLLSRQRQSNYSRKVKKRKPPCELFCCHTCISR